MANITGSTLLSGSPKRAVSLFVKMLCLDGGVFVCLGRITTTTELLKLRRVRGGCLALDLPLAVLDGPETLNLKAQGLNPWTATNCFT